MSGVPEDLETGEPSLKIKNEVTYFEEDNDEKVSCKTCAQKFSNIDACVKHISMVHLNSTPDLGMSTEIQTLDYCDVVHNVNIPLAKKMKTDVDHNVGGRHEIIKQVMKEIESPLEKTKNVEKSQDIIFEIEIEVPASTKEDCYESDRHDNLGSQSNDYNENLDPKSKLARGFLEIKEIGTVDIKTEINRDNLNFNRDLEDRDNNKEFKAQKKKQLKVTEGEFGKNIATQDACFLESSNAAVLRTLLLRKGTTSAQKIKTDNKNCIKEKYEMIKKVKKENESEKRTTTEQKTQDLKFEIEIETAAANIVEDYSENNGQNNIELPRNDYNENIDLKSELAQDILGNTSLHLRRKENEFKDGNINLDTRETLKNLKRPEVFTCLICNYKSKQHSNIKRHIRTHTGEKPFGCHLCDYRCKQKTNLDEHIRTHTDEKPFACHICGFKSNQKSNLRRHVMIHTGQKLYECKLCEFKCKTSKTLKNHTRLHRGELYVCDLCDYKCKTRSTLTNHSRKHKGTQFVCKICDYKCVVKSHLERHIKIHTGEKPFACTICEFRCKTSKAFQNHKNIHNGFVLICDNCHFRCEDKDSLVVHMRQHTG